MKPIYDQAVRAEMEIRKRMSPPSRETVAEIARSTGITTQTLYNWRGQWQKQGRLAAVIQASGLSGSDLGASGSGAGVGYQGSPLRSRLVRPLNRGSRPNETPREPVRGGPIKESPSVRGWQPHELGAPRSLRDLLGLPHNEIRTACPHRKSV